MAEIKIQIIGLHILQGAVNLLKNMFSGKAPVVDAGPHREEYLAGNHIGASRVILQSFPKEFFRTASIVAIGAVEEIDTALIS